MIDRNAVAKQSRASVVDAVWSVVAARYVIALLLVMSSVTLQHAVAASDQQKAQLLEAARTSVGQVRATIANQGGRLDQIVQAHRILSAELGNAMPKDLVDGLLEELKILEVLRKTYPIVSAAVDMEDALLHGAKTVSRDDLVGLITNTDAALHELVEELDAVRARRQQFAERLASIIQGLIASNPVKIGTYIGVKQRLTPTALDLEITLQRSVLAALQINLQVLGN